MKCRISPRPADSAVPDPYGRSGALRKLLVFAAMVLGLPLLGVSVAGEPVSRYLEFPPTTRYVEHAPFSFPLFLLGCLIVSAVVAPFALRAVRYRPVSGPDSSGLWTFPLWGWAGVVSGILFWTLAWTRFAWFAPYQAHTFTPLWLSFVVVVNALSYRKTGKCLMTERPVFFLLLFPASAVFWWSFEYLNRFVQNWYYLDTGGYSGWEYFWLATLPFATVLPAVLSAREWIGAFPRFEEPFRAFLPLSIRRPRPVSWAFLAAAAGSLVGIGVWPDLLYPFLWVSPLVVLLSLDGIAGSRHVLSGASEGDWRETVGFGLAALLCGIFWELWNAHSLAKWEYSIPFVQRFLLFEMPVLGYSGYLPFGMECAAVAGLLEELVRPPGAGTRRDGSARASTRGEGAYGCLAGSRDREDASKGTSLVSKERPQWTRSFFSSPATAERPCFSSASWRTSAPPFPRSRCSFWPGRSPSAPGLPSPSWLRVRYWGP